MIVWECALVGKRKHALAKLSSEVGDWLLTGDEFDEIPAGHDCGGGAVGT